MNGFCGRGTPEEVGAWRAVGSWHPYVWGLGAEGLSAPWVLKSLDGVGASLAEGAQNPEPKP